MNAIGKIGTALASVGAAAVITMEVLSPSETIEQQENPVINIETNVIAVKTDLSTNIADNSTGIIADGKNSDSTINQPKMVYGAKSLSSFTTLASPVENSWNDDQYSIDQSETYEINEADLDIENGETKVIHTSDGGNGGISITYSDPILGGNFNLENNAHVEILVVGGGGAGGTVGVYCENGAAGGGGAGGVSELTTVLVPGTYQIQVGAGAKRVDSYVQSWVGNNGGISALISPAGSFVTSAKGGGGGGAPKDNGYGADGGSGGGGSWFGTALAGGTYTDGYGWYGATPVNANIGGGGGGASVDALQGSGKVDGTGGIGRFSDITGENICYGFGGNGGNRTDPNYIPQDGVTPGSGGDGAGNPGPGGAGANGVVIVKIIDFFDIVKVPYPVYTDTFGWTNGMVYTAVDLTQAPASYRNAIESVDGTTSVTCSIDGNGITNGLGRFSFTITLKEGYVWDDGTENGFNAPKTFFWRVREPDVVGNALAEVTKTVDWFEGTNATIFITSHTTPEKRKALPNILFLGTMCSSHSLTRDKVKMAINAASESAKQVDYFLYKGRTETLSGSLKGGAQMTDSDFGNNTFSGGQHKSLNVFYNKLYDVLSNESTVDFYDYIIFEFDGSRLAHGYTSSSSYEQSVANWLIPYYENEKVILIVDNAYGDGGSHSSETLEPWYVDYWRPNTYMYSAGSKNLAFTALKGQIGMFYPMDYKYYSGKTQFSAVGSPYITSKSFKPADLTTTSTYYAGRRYPIQTTYENGNNLADYIRNQIKAVEYSVQLNDNIKLASGLNLNNAHGYWTTNEELSTSSTYEGWNILDSSTLVTTEYGVEIKINGVSTETWLKLWLDVTDTGTFRSSIGAKYNTRTGLWEKDPNDGPVTVFTQRNGVGELAQDSASTEVAWSYAGYELTGGVISNTNGLYTGDILVNGYSTNWVSVAEGTSPQVIFRGAPGYILDELWVDHQKIENPDITTSDWLFEYIKANHDVQVSYKAYNIGNPEPETQPVVMVYDGTNYAPTVTGVSFTEEIPYEWFPVYSLTPDGEFTKDGGQKDVVYDENGNITSTNVYVKIAVIQPGYEEPVILDNWVGVNTVTILPREIEVTFANYVQADDTRKTTDFEWNQTDGELIDGDSIIVNDSKCIDYPAKGDHTEDSITSENIKVYDENGNVNGNYIIHVVNGDYYYPKNEIIAEAVGVEKIYDGKPSTITVTATVPRLPTADEIKAQHSGQNSYNNIQNIKTDGVVIKYSADGGMTYTLDNPPYTDVSNNKVYYQVSYSYTFQHRRSNRYSWTTDTVNFNTITGSADVIIHPRPVTVTAENGAWCYTGETYTASGIEIEPPTDTTGFVDGEGANFTLTDDSWIKEPGMKSNKIDQSKTAPYTGTKLSNYDIQYVDGILIIHDAISAKSNDIEKIYDGETEMINIIVRGYDGEILDPSEYTIKYSQYPNVPDSWSTNNPSYKDVCISNAVYYIVEKDGCEPVEGKAYITIIPREIIVTTDDKSKYYGEDDPEFTWYITDGTNSDGTVTGVLPGEEKLVVDLVADNSDVFREPGEDETLDDEGYPIHITGGEYMGNYHVTYVDGELIIIKRHHIAEPLIAEFTLSLENDKLETMKIWTTRTIETNDVIYIYAAKTFKDAKAGNWIKLANSGQLYQNLYFDEYDPHHICEYPDVIFTEDEINADYRFFKPFIETWEGDVFEGRKYVGVVDNPVDDYGETAVGVPFTRCLSTASTNGADYVELEDLYDPEIYVFELVQTNALDKALDKLAILNDCFKSTFDWYSLNDDYQWEPWYVENSEELPPEITEFKLKRGMGFSIKHMVNYVYDDLIIRVHGQVDETQVDYNDLIVKGGLTMLSNGLPDEMNLNVEMLLDERGLDWTTDANITYMSEDDYTYAIKWDKANLNWYYNKTMISKGKRTVTKVDPPIIPPGRVFWFKDGTTISPAVPVEGLR